MSLPASHRRRALHPFGVIRSSTPAPGPARRPSPYSRPPTPSTRSRTPSHLPSDEETSCFNDVYLSDDENARTPSKKVHFQPSSNSLSTPSASGTSTSQDEDAESTDDEDDGKIPKPKGEVGRPNRGGYNLRIALGWSDERYDKVKNFMNDLVDNNLDGRAPLSDQTLISVQNVRNQAIAKYKFLDEYREHWVINDFIKTRLKVRKNALEKKEGAKAVAEVRGRVEKKKKSTTAD